MGWIIQDKRLFVNEATERGKVIFPDSVLKILPAFLVMEIEKISCKFKKIEEIRIRLGASSSLTADKKNIFLKSFVSKEDMEKIVSAACEGSFYAYGESIKKGYISIGDGVRLGIGGRASVEEGRIIGIRDISALNIRLPSYIKNVGRELCQSVLRMKDINGSGVLIYSPPGEGKTTLLKSLALQLSAGKNAMRVIVVDTRNELSQVPLGGQNCLDILVGYPKAEGIEIATRTMNAEIIVCDEIGSEEDVKAVLSAQNCGVPILATSHAASLSGLLNRSGISHLHKACAFDMYVGIRRVVDQEEYIYDITSWEEADRKYGG